MPSVRHILLGVRVLLLCEEIPRLCVDTFRFDGEVPHWVVIVLRPGGEVLRLVGKDLCPGRKDGELFDKFHRLIAGPEEVHAWRQEGSADAVTSCGEVYG